MRHEAIINRQVAKVAQRQVAVIGGGIVGTAITEALLRQGHKVTIIEPGAFGGEQAASYGNGAFISPASHYSDVDARIMASGAGLPAQPEWPLDDPLAISSAAFTLACSFSFGGME